jgi:hypothetical protein
MHGISCHVNVSSSMMTAHDLITGQAYKAHGGLARLQSGMDTSMGAL